MKQRVGIVLSVILLAGAFGYGVIHLFNLRFASGDIYPAYSSFRSDPLGTKVFYESLHALGRVNVRRNLQPPQRLPEGRDCTLFVLALPWNELWAEDAEYRKLDAFVRNGGRLVITLYPEFSRPRGFGGLAVTNSPVFKRNADDHFGKPTIDLTEKWGFQFAHAPVARRGDYSFPPVTARTLLAQQLPEKVSWHSALVFTNLNFDWRVVYARDTDPVMIERSLGSGSIVLATDSYFVSNEALREEREARLLAWLAGRNSEIVFNETHLGVLEQPGIAALARRYNLYGGVIALLVVALLFVWKSSVSFAPATGTSQSAALVAGRESATGFVNLLRRSVAPKDLLQTCLNEWHKSLRLETRVSPRKLEKVRAAVESYNAAEKPNAVETYRRISDILNERQP